MSEEQKKRGPGRPRKTTSIFNDSQVFRFDESKITTVLVENAKSHSKRNAGLDFAVEYTVKDGEGNVINGASVTATISSSVPEIAQTA